MRTKSIHVNLKKWFPAKDVVAANVARLCILKEDLEIEYSGFLEEDFQNLDKNGIPWRKLYFLRNIFRTMMEIHSAVHSLESNANFKNVISDQPETLRKAFDNLSIEMNSAHSLIKEYRNAIGGHVKEKAVMDALNNMPPSRAGFLEFEIDPNQYHLKFASELCMAIMFDEVPKEEQRKKAKDIISKLKNTLPFKAIDAVITTYIKTHGLWV
jgi:hypothetical protein